jgi:hypothetical protein
MHSLPDIRADVLRLALNIGAGEKHLPTFGYSKQPGWPSVEVSTDQYHYVVAQSDQEPHRRSTSDYQELLYWIFSGVTQSMVFADDSDLRQPGQEEYWAITYPKQIELIGRIDPNFVLRLTAEIDSLLAMARRWDLI